MPLATNAYVIQPKVCHERVLQESNATSYGTRFACQLNTLKEV